MKIIVKIYLMTILITIIFSGCVGYKYNKVPPNITENTGDQGQQDNISYTGILENAKNVSEFAKKDAISRFNLTEDIVRVESVVPVEWTDTSLGYPEPGKEPGKDYEIKAIRGYTILIYAKTSKDAKGKLYEYHSDYSRIAPPSGPIEDLENMPRMINKSGNSPDNVVELAKKDIMLKYNVLGQDIKVINIKPVDWPDTSLGNPQPGMAYAQVITPGFIIILIDRNNTYEYYTSYDRVILFKVQKG